MYQTDVTYYLDQILDDSISKETCLEFIYKYDVKCIINNKFTKIEWSLLSLDYLKDLIKDLIDFDSNIVYAKVKIKRGVQK